MRNEVISIISEGLEDQGVLTSILKALKFDGSEIKYIRPELSRDATDEHISKNTIGTLQGVKNSCEGTNGKRPDFEKALLLQNCNTIIIQIDTAEIEKQDFPFTKPKKQNNSNYSKELRNKIICTINNWLDNKFKENLLFAISIEEIEAWCLTIFEQKNTINAADPKKKLQTYLNRNNFTYKKLKLDPLKHKREYFEAFTRKKGFQKIKKLKQYAEYNESLKDFIISVEQRVIK